MSEPYSFEARSSGMGIVQQGLRWFGKLQSNPGSTLLILAAIGVGAALGARSSSIGSFSGGSVDYTVLALIALLFFDVRITSIPRTRASTRFIITAWCTNFLLIPLIGFVLATVAFRGNTAVATGLLIYFMAPCTDWFLGFTRLAKGNTNLGSALIPINMVSQLALYPVFLLIFTRWQGTLEIEQGLHTIVLWFVVPAMSAIALRSILEAFLPTQRLARVVATIQQMIPWVIAVLALEIFAANITTIQDHATVFGRALLVVFVFFVVTYLLGEQISRRLRFAYPEHALFTMTTAARNAPLMLGITTIAIPNEPLIYAALIIGMLIEFPHLIALKHLLVSRKYPTGSELQSNSGVS